LVNFGPEPVEIRPDDRIAQLVVSPVLHVEWQEVEALPTTGRGDGGFGSTGGGAQRDGVRD
jgi:dUTP pyrophosphatase